MLLGGKGGSVCFDILLGPNCQLELHGTVLPRRPRHYGRLLDEEEVRPARHLISSGVGWGLSGCDLQQTPTVFVRLKKQILLTDVSSPGVRDERRVTIRLSAYLFLEADERRVGPTQVTTTWVTSK